MNEENPTQSNEESGSRLQPDEPAVDPHCQIRAKYTKLIRLRGITSSQTEINARNLGIDVDALVAEREREINAWKVIDVRLDLATLTLDSQGNPAECHFAPWESKAVLPTANTPVLDLPGLSLYGSIPLDPGLETTVARLLRAGVILILSKLREDPDEFRHTLPWGIKDIELDRLIFSESRKNWTLCGGQKPAALERTSRALNPLRSIDLARRAVYDGVRVSAKPWPELKEVWLRIDHWPSGALHVAGAFATREECGLDRVSTYPDQPHTFITKYPSTGRFKWGEVRSTKPATHFLRVHSYRQAGELAESAGTLGVESVICDYSKPMPATDYRASIRSGTDGPAPMPPGMAWPICRDCGEIPSFWESIDFRDVSFSHLLPGTTLSIFVCDRCLTAGEWLSCSTLIWLPRDEAVGLISKGDPKPLVEACQWIDRDCSYDDIPEALAARIETEWPEHLPCGLASIAGGTKAGGLPDYFQEDPTLFDAGGCLMDYIGQFTSPESCWFDGYGYIFHSAITGETVAALQTT